MGTLSEELAMTMLRDFQMAVVMQQAEWEMDLAARASKPPVWRWAPGTFVFPEGLCCYCGGVMRSPCIWRAENLQFHGSWKVVEDGDGIGHFAVDLTHPHVHNGSICMGTGNYRTNSVADALFLAFNPFSTYFGDVEDPVTGEFISTNTRIKAWFADRFNHNCDESAEVQTASGIDNRHLVEPEDGCHCQHCRIHRKEVRCQREACGQWFNPEVGHGRFRCVRCNPRNTQHFCVKHKHEKHKCMDCTDSHDLYDVVLGQLSTDPQIKQCGECAAWVCIYCLGEAGGSTPQHECVSGAAVAEKGDELHERCGCTVCCECGGEGHCDECGSRDGCECDRCSDCGEFEDSCTC